MSLAGQWREIEGALPDGWSGAGLRLTVSDPTRADRAAALLGPAQPYRAEVRVLRFLAARNGTAPGPSAVASLLVRLDRERIGGTLELVSSEAVRAPAPVAPTTLAESWRAELAKVPPDWSDVYAELELRSTDYVERAALLCSPLNPRRDGARPALRFRCARSFGYGAAPAMVLRCLERCDAETIRGTARILRALSDTKPAHTQGPVWQIHGQTV